MTEAAGTISCQAYRPGGLSSPDYEELRDFLVDLNSPLWPFARWDWMIAHTLLDREWLGGIGLWRNGAGVVVAAALYDCQPGATYLLTRPGYASLELELLRHAERHLNPGQDFCLVIPEDDSALQQTAADRGYVPGAESEVVSAFDCRIPQAPVTLPRGFRMTDLEQTFAPVQFGAAIWRGFNHELNGKRSKLTAELRELLTLQVRRPHVDPALKLAVVAADGEFACCGGFWQDPRTASAVIEPLATVPGYRGRGLARAIVQEGIRRVAAHGATQVLVGSALPFYNHLGFLPCLRAIRWRKTN